MKAGIKYFKENTLTVFCFAIGSISLLINFVISSTGYLWLDEVYTLMNIDFQSLVDLVNAFWKGADTHPPEYFVLAYCINAVFHSVFALQLLSLILCVAGLFFLKQTFYKIPIDIFGITFVALSTIPFFSIYLTSEIRPYSLYFFSTAFLVWSTKRTLRFHKGQIAFILSSILFILSHYFALIYYVVLLFLVILNTRREPNTFIIYTSTTIIIFCGIPLLFLMYNQISAIEFLVWQKTPTVIDLIHLIKSFITYSVLILIVITIVFGLKDKRTSVFVAAERKNEWIMVISLFIIPLLLFTANRFGYGVFSERYFIPTFYGIIVMLLLVLDTFLHTRKMKIIIVCMLTPIMAYRIFQNAQSTEIDRNKMTELLKLSGKDTPVLCESPHMYFPLKYYSKGTKRVLLIMDSLSSIQPGSVKNAKFDYYQVKNMVKYHKDEGIMSWEEFVRNNNRFIIINETDRMFFEFRILNSTQFVIDSTKDNIIFVSKNL